MPSAAKTTKRRGRRQGEPVSRDTVLSAAKQRFATEGYEKTTLRVIAQDAHVDPSMVLYLFGSKEELFRESLRLIIDPEVLVAALTGAADDDPDIGTRMVRTYLRIWETPDTAASMRAMLQSATSNSDAQDAFRGFMQNYVLTAVSGVLGGGEEARLRAILAASTLVGTAMLRYIIQVPPLATLSADIVVTLIAPTVTRYLTAAADELGLPDLYPVNSFVQHKKTDHDQDARDESGVLTLHPVLEPPQRFVETVTRNRIRQNGNRDGRAGERHVPRFCDPCTGRAQPGGPDRQTRCGADE